MPFFLILAGMLGAALGSFASVLVARADNPRSVIFAGEGEMARSACPHCSRALTWVDLLPLFGWLFAKGKCRSCKSPIGLRYLIYEIVGFAVMAGLFFKNGFNLAFVLMIGGLPFAIAAAALLSFHKPVPLFYQIGVLITVIAALLSM